MTQTALNEWLPLPADTWVKFSEINCTFVVVKSDTVEILGTDGATPDPDTDEGIPYPLGSGEDAETRQLERFVGAGAAPDGLWAISRGQAGALFVSREAVA